MRKLITLSIVLFICIFPLLEGWEGAAFAQQNVGIGTTAPNPSARLDIFSDNQGLLIPRVSLFSTTDVNTIPNPAISLLVYNTNPAMAGGGLGIYYWSGTVWVQAFGVA